MGKRKKVAWVKTAGPGPLGVLTGTLSHLRRTSGVPSRLMLGAGLGAGGAALTAPTDENGQKRIGMGRVLGGAALGAVGGGLTHPAVRRSVSRLPGAMSAAQNPVKADAKTVAHGLTNRPKSMPKPPVAKPQVTSFESLQGQVSDKSPVPFDQLEQVVAKRPDSIKPTMPTPEQVMAHRRVAPATAPARPVAPTPASARPAPAPMPGPAAPAPTPMSRPAAPAPAPAPAPMPGPVAPAPRPAASAPGVSVADPRAVAAPPKSNLDLSEFGRAPRPAAPARRVASGMPGRPTASRPVGGPAKGSAPPPAAPSQAMPAPISAEDRQKQLVSQMNQRQSDMMFEREIASMPREQQIAARINRRHRMQKVSHSFLKSAALGPAMTALKGGLGYALKTPGLGMRASIGAAVGGVGGAVTAPKDQNGNRQGMVGRALGGAVLGAAGGAATSGEFRSRVGQAFGRARAVSSRPVASSGPKVIDLAPSQYKVAEAAQRGLKVGSGR